MPAVLCLGEILVDWVCTTAGAELDQAKSFTKAPGGAPANTAVGLARQGIEVGFVGRVSKDGFGRWLLDVLVNEGIDVSGTILDPLSQTRMAYVITTASGDRKLAEFTKIACADVRLAPEDLQPEQFTRAKVLHFGSMSLLASPAIEAVQKAVELARANNLLISYDPNARLALWSSADACKQAILNTLHLADLLKVNEDELEFLTGARDFAAADELRRKYNVPLMVVTLDSRGAYFTTEKGGKQVGGFSIQLVEATGAGDGFNSGMISQLLGHLKPAEAPRTTLSRLSLDQISAMVHYANAVGALTCTRAGAIPALPTSKEVKTFLNKQQPQLCMM